MAVMKKKGGKGVPAISTSSLPDIIFMLLFYFMTTTVMRETNLMVDVQLPSASEVQKIEKKSLVSYIYIGPPNKAYIGKMGDNTRLQLNGAFKDVSEILDFIAAERDKLSESDRPYMTVSLKGHKNTRMGLITDVKQELRKANALKIIYPASKVMRMPE